MVTSCSHFSVCSGPEFAFCSVLPIAIRTESLFDLSNQAWLLPVTWMSSCRSTNRSTTKASDIRFTECIGVDQSLDNRPCIASLIGSMNGPHQVGGVKMEVLCYANRATRYVFVPISVWPPIQKRKVHGFCLSPFSLFVEVLSYQAEFCRTDCPRFPSQAGI